MTVKIEKKQGELAVERVRVVDDIEMGVMSDGTPFLTQRGVATVCSVAPSVITEWAQEYSPDSLKKRDQAITRLLSNHGYDGDLFYELEHKGQKVNAYPDAVCMALLEYYGFEAQLAGQAKAQQNFRVLARGSLRQFIYRAVGYDPQKLVPEKWRQFHDRMQLNKVPAGYFSVFREIAEICVDAINVGLVMDEHTIPDGSVGKVWGKHWIDNGLDAKHGARVKHPHKYPDYFPQSLANDFIEAWVYPLDALGRFRIWLRDTHLPTNYPKYLAGKVKSGALPMSSVELLLSEINEGAA